MSGETLPGKVVKKRIWLVCPVCKKTGSIVLQKDLMDEVIRDGEEWMMEVQVFKGEICDHEFTVRLDANLRAR